MDVKKCDYCGLEIDPNEQETIVNGSDVCDYCEECFGEALVDYLKCNGYLHLDKTDERTYAF